ncbi:Rv2231c family pyridoxal phosphate-dependent protein CobC [Streptomyces sp. RTd22]|uniref:Rv2231c family pyridoxal phosphate-dependent protein CobC n=1 Tax=Streptomyces sp. RTd22 TaxID=1841249 RepID=UPI001F2A25A7|nr:Rv2231c family pyridoxal phosphate-dependent protein CobC [Streptomyces sp. RTd22]
MPTPTRTSTPMSAEIPAAGIPAAGTPARETPACETPADGAVPGFDLRHHGDAEVRGADAGLTDLAVNVRAGTPPRWLKDRIAASLDGLAAYPDGRAARAAVAACHGVPEGRVLLTAGAAEAFVLIARALPARRPVVVHPQFTEPEAALRDAGHTVERVLLDERDGFRLDPAAVPDDADLVVVGNPTNPTSVLHPAAVLAELARPGRTLVVDEAFMDAVPGEPASLASRTDVPGLVVLRSLTKTWGLAGLRIGYVLAAPGIIAALERVQPLWPVSTPALAAAEACCAPDALAEAARAAERAAADRAYLADRLGEFAEAGLRVCGPAAGPFLLIRLPDAAAIRTRLRELGFAVRRGDTFPGLGPDWLRLAVRDRETTDRFMIALAKALQDG